MKTMPYPGKWVHPAGATRVGLWCSVALSVGLMIFGSGASVCVGGTLMVRAARAEAGLCLSWRANPGETYQIQKRALWDRPWTTVGSETIRLSVLDTQSINRELPADEGAAFFRVVKVDSDTPSLVWIPSGSFVMGSPAADPERLPFETPQTTVRISQGFWMGEYEVTQQEFGVLMMSNPSLFTGDSRRPVDQVTWNEAVEYCRRLTDRERSGGGLPADWAYRLPTEAEWEYACRAGTTTRYLFGDGATEADLSGFAWFGNFSSGTTHPVGQKWPNPWGLYDILGNVFEWCSDYWATRLPGGEVVDPQGPTSGYDRVNRGGSYYCPPMILRSAQRVSNSPELRLSLIGFRVVLARGHGLVPNADIGKAS